MFRDLCAVTDADTTLFLALCALIGLLAGVVLAWFVRGRWEGQGPKIGCISMPLTGFAGGYVAALVFPDPRKDGVMCGYTPDVIFSPVYALAVVPIAVVIAFAIGLHRLSKGKGGQ